MATKYVKDSRGKFAGSIGDGKSQVPTCAPTSASVPVSQGEADDTSPISGAFARFQSKKLTGEFQYSHEDLVVMFELQYSQSDKGEADYDGSASLMFPNVEPEARTRFLVEHLDVNARKFFATSLSSSPEMLEALSRDDDREVVNHVALNPQTPAGTLEHFARNESEYIRATTARNPNLTIAGKLALLRDAHPRVREAAARYIRLPSTGVTAVVNSSDASLKRGLACSEFVDMKTLAKLATDGDPNVRRLVMVNPRTGRDVLWLGQFDANRGVAASASRAFEALTL